MYLCRLLHGQPILKKECKRLKKLKYTIYYRKYKMVVKMFNHVDDIDDHPYFWFLTRFIKTI